MTQEIKSVRPTPVRPLAEARPDLIHPFQYQPGREGECSHFYSSLGGFVKCNAKESDPIHHNGPHLLTAANGEQAYCSDDYRTCEFCAREVFRSEERSEERFRKWNAERSRQQSQ